jgi:hypothetical protein
MYNKITNHQSPITNHQSPITNHQSPINLSLKKILKCFVPYGFIVLKRKIKQYKASEQKKHFGKKYPNITFYIIRRSPPGAGLFSNFHWVLGHVMYALEKGYIPIVDMKKYKTFFNEKHMIDGTYNAWEYYFKQPTAYTLDDVYHSNSVILADAEHYFNDKAPYFLDNNIHIHLMNSVINKYLQFNEKTLKQIEEQKIVLFRDYNNILGVKYRGTDYTAEVAPEGHYIPASLEEIIVKTKELYSEWNMEWIYLSTEESLAVDAFRKVFSNKIIVTNSVRIDTYSKEMGSSSEINFGRKNDNYLKGLDYIVDTVLLSKCDALITSKNNGSMAAMELNDNQYKYKYIFENGVYKKTS